MSYSGADATNSLIETGAPGVSDGVDGNIVGQEPLLFPLGDYGGLTETHALQDGSPCIGTGSNPNALTTDQRGAGLSPRGGHRRTWAQWNT